MQLCHLIAGRGLAREQEGAGDRGGVRVALQAQVMGHDLQAGQQLALVLVDPLHVDDEHRVGRQLDACPVADQRGEVPLVGLLDRVQRVQQLLVVGVGAERLQAGQLGKIDPAPADTPGQQAGQARVGVQQPAARGHAVGLVVEPLRPQLVEVRQQVRLDQLGVHRRDTVDAVSGDGREVRHPHLPARPFLDDRHAREPIALARPAQLCLPEEPLVDLVDDLKVARQEPFEQRHRPALQRLGEQRVVRVADAPFDDRPPHVPVQPFVVDQHAHQLGHRDRRVRVVQLDGELVGEGAEVGVLLLEPPDHVGNRAGHEEILLLEAQLLALVALIVRVEDLGDVLGVDLLLHGAAEVAFVEELEVEVARRARRPKAQGVRGVGAVADDERIVGQPDDVAGLDPVGAQAPVAVVLEHHAPAEVHGLRVLVPRQLPRVAEVQPVVVLLDLATAVDPLFEHAEVVADAVADRGELQGCQGVHEAGGQPPQAAVAQARITFALQNLSQVEAVIGRQRHRRIVEVHVHQAQTQAAPGQELRRQIADPLDVAGDVRPLRRQPAMHQPIADRVRERVIKVERRGVADLLRAGVHDVSGDRCAKVCFYQAGALAGGALLRRAVVRNRRSNGDAHACMEPRPGPRTRFIGV